MTALEIVLMVLYGSLSLYGLFIMGESLLWRIHARRVTGRVIGFQKKRSFGRKLPVVAPGDVYLPVEAEAACRIQKIDSMTYLIRFVHNGDEVDVSMHTKKTGQGRIAGFAPLVLGSLLQWPLFFTILGYLDPITQQGVSLLFFVVMGIGLFWVFMRFVRYHY